MTIMNTFPSWNTKKTEEGFVATVNKIESLSVRNADGVFCDTTQVQQSTFSSRAKAKTWAQKWVRFYNHNGFDAV